MKNNRTQNEWKGHIMVYLPHYPPPPSFCLNYNPSPTSTGNIPELNQPSLSVYVVPPFPPCCPLSHSALLSQGHQVASSSNYLHRAYTTDGDSEDEGKEDWSSDEDDEDDVAKGVLEQSFDQMFQEVIREKPSTEKYLKLARLAQDVCDPS